jgi:hypothetical protein
LRSGVFEVAGSLYDTETYTAVTVQRIDAVTADRDAVAARFTRHRYRNLATFDGSTFRTTVSGARPGTPRYRHQHPLLSTVPRPLPSTAHGYEDVGWSMVPLEGLARATHVQTPALSKLIDDWNAYTGTDYRAVGRSATCLGIGIVPEKNE